MTDVGESDLAKANELASLARALAAVVNTRVTDGDA